ncbi:MAG: hypothetical protein ACOYLQ_09675 [Hyphomicrobiaceae bacterium]
MPPLTPQQRANIMLEGFNAARDGVWAGSDSCPYSRETPEGQAWVEGFVCFHNRVPPWPNRISIKPWLSFEALLRPLS